MQAFVAVEMFSGDAAVAKSCRYGLYATCQMDINLGTAYKHKVNAFDLASAPGLPQLVIIIVDAVFNSFGGHVGNVSHIMALDGVM